MKTQWFSGLKPSERDYFKQEVLNSKKVLDKLDEICYNMYIERREVISSDYETASWSHQQAHTNGFCEALKKIREIIDIKDAPTSG